MSNPQTRSFARFADTPVQSQLRSAITAAYRAAETDCVPALIVEAQLTPADSTRATVIATQLVLALRKTLGDNGVQALLREYALSSQEGVALMCLAEALLRIPDNATRNALIRDKIGGGDWSEHAGQSASFFVNAATWGLIVTGKLTNSVSQRGLSAALTGMLVKGGEPLIRKGVEIAMRVMGEQFVRGQTIEAALTNSEKLVARGFRYSYDMLGEAALTAADAQRYFDDYENAIHTIGKAAGKRGVFNGPGISVKLSALHPRYSRAQVSRITSELLPRLRHLALLACHYDIALNIDAEEADRLDISLDLLESLCVDPALSQWNGIGFVVQAYQKRCRSVINWLIDLGRRSHHRLMIRLVKGAYWDAEIKRAQVDGLADFPVFTRKIHTDVSYLACAKALLGAPDAVFPQFATHNAQTVSAIYVMAGGDKRTDQYEFQCLHGMGEPLYEEVVGASKLGSACRIYAPVGTHETLLAYLVRRLLENGANSSFVNRIADPAIAIDALLADPVLEAQALSPVGSPHPRISHPRHLFGDARLNSSGIDLSNESTLATLSGQLRTRAATHYLAATHQNLPPGAMAGRPVFNPANHADVVGRVVECSTDAVKAACTAARTTAPRWAATPAADRAAVLERAADIFDMRMTDYVGLIVRESGKSVANAIAEAREAVDFLRYYAVMARQLKHVSYSPLGPVACISPWNFPLAIFVGQIAAALAAGNTVLAKPSEETPLIAALAMEILHEAGVPPDVAQLLPGDGEVGAALVANAHVCGVLFTGSVQVARLIQRELSKRTSLDGSVIPLIAETGGQNAMIVDSSALPEQVVADVITSAFDSAGQRCSALRVLCLQSDVADRIITMLQGAMQELVVGNPDQLSTDVGPVISPQARSVINTHIVSMRESGHRVFQTAPTAAFSTGTFVAPTVIEINKIDELEREVFGPVLHVLRYDPSELDGLLDSINATGYGLTFGLHTRIDETVLHITERIAAGNLYINRNVIGAVVGVQPFGGHGLSGTGPKAGGPLYVERLTVRGAQSLAPARVSSTGDGLYLQFLLSRGHDAAANVLRASLQDVIVDQSVELPGPVGERNVYQTAPRGTIVALAADVDASLVQIGMILATGNRVVMEATNPAIGELASLPTALAARITIVTDWRQVPTIGGILYQGSSAELLSVNGHAASLEGPITLIQSVPLANLLAGTSQYSASLLVNETSISTNTAAAGGNASLMMLQEA